ncbi:hypothetical protein ACWDO0_02705 [Nocardia rhamnosiphila]
MTGVSPTQLRAEFAAALSAFCARDLGRPAAAIGRTVHLPDSLYGHRVQRSVENLGAESGVSLPPVGGLI